MEQHRNSRTAFAEHLAPLAISQQQQPLDCANSGVFRTSAQIAATPHTPVNRKLITDRCSSRVIPRPRSSTAATSAAPLMLPQPSNRCPTAPQLRRAASPLFASEYTAAARRCSTAQQAAPATAAPPAPAVPPVLQFEGWWLQTGRAGATHKCSIHITYHTDTDPAAFFVRGDLDSSNSSKEPHCRCAACDQRDSDGRSRCATADSACKQQPAVALPPQGAWMSVVGASGEPLDHWDLHVGAELSLGGRKVILKRASCATMAWLDACAKLLLQQQHSLEQQLSKFTAVIPGQGLVRHSPQRSDYASHNLPVTPTGGSVNLRHLREGVALLAARLRQHKAAVLLPKALQDLTPQGPTSWEEPGLPQVMFVEPFTPAPAKHSSGTHLLQREFARDSVFGAGRLPTLGTTPAGDRVPSHHNIMQWLDSIPLAASAARTMGQQPKSPSQHKHPSKLLELAL